MHAGVHLHMIGCGRAKFQVRMFEFCDRVSAASGVGTQANCESQSVTNMFNPMLPNNIPADLSEQAVTITSLSCMQHLFIDTTSFFLEA